ncbi:MBL fold metallo-hydrolase [Pseudohoeflea coraliihabitans]|uniref:MBL fold metallo-hydrolase n=1 Tax=Pseudohoeflea coraliihabitans TaxID=2860393 RepID=A0ABS6WLD2_9HYPH|nr:MBL fold metallo-hydrolase [Pseudohoeflea sp. DP4N28-3]MBW3096771.1 MBL fold metallo-hydrolase [Pseudohoeflea sp. DP4N28-3]
MLKRTSPSRGPGSPEVTGFYEKDSGSIQYVAADPQTRKAALIDIVQDLDPASARTSMDSAEEVLRFVEQRDYAVEWILDTHPHADHLMAAHWLKEKTGAPMAIGEKVHAVAELWRDLYHMPDAFDPDACFDRLFAESETFSLGSLEGRVMFTPGHTLATITYVIGDAAFVNDTFMHVDFGSARADFPGGSSRQLYQSLQDILSLPDETRLFVGHDYGTDEREEPAWEATVAEHRRRNAHIGTEIEDAAHDEDAFINLRDTRDKKLGLPDRMLIALQVNLRGGRLPEPEADGNRYFRIPANRL